MSRHKLYSPGCVLIVFMTAALIGARAQEPSPAEQAPPQGIEELKQKIQEILTRGHVPGAGIALVAKDHIIWAGGVGKADVTGNKDVTAETIFRVGSISKSFVALALLKLQEEGKIDLNAKLADIAPEIPVHNEWEATHPIRIVNLLEHTAGFDDMHASGAYNVQDPPDIKLLDVLQKFSSPLEARWPPGTRTAYSNPDYGIAGYLIEKITNEAYDIYIRENILLPLGMLNSDFRLTNLNQPLLANGYRDASLRPVPYVSIYLRPAGDLKSSPEEMAHFIQMILNRGKLGDTQIVKPESLDRMEYPQTTLAARAGLKDGYGLANYTDLYGPVAAHGHNGGIDGFLSVCGYMTNQGVGYAAFQNSTASGKSLRDITRLLQDFLLANKTIPAPPVANTPPGDLEQFTGYYEKANPRNQMFAFVDLLLGGKRTYVSGGILFEKDWFAQPKGLVAVSANQFRLEKEPEASTIFFNDEDGTPVMANLFFFGRKTSAVWPMTRLALVLGALGIMATSILFALVWIPMKLLGKIKGAGSLSARYVPLLAAVSLGAAVLLLNAIPGWYAGTYNILTVGIWLLTWVFAGLSVWGLWLSVRSFTGDVKPAVRIHSLLVSIACCGITAYLAWEHLIGIRLWAP